MSQLSENRRLSDLQNVLSSFTVFHSERTEKWQEIQPRQNASGLPRCTIFCGINGQIPLILHLALQLAAEA